MKKIYYLLFILLLSQSVALAQRENYNWHFGRKSVVEFNTGGPVAKTTTSLISYEACSSISDGAGQLLFYSNSEKVWNRNHALMPNGAALSSSGTSSTQGALIVPHPGNPALYYIFLTDESERKLEAGFRYAVVDMRLANGLGDLTGPAVRLPTSTLTGKVAEKLTAIRHADGRGYWVLVHAWGSNNFYSFLLTAAGISATPVVSAVGPVLNDDNTPVPYANAIGYLRASPDGLHLAMACRDRDLELYDFDPATGIASNFVSLPTGVSTQPNRYGLEFSPDGSRLYSGVSASDLSFSLLQYDMNAGGGAAIASSRQVVGTGRSGTGALLLAPDGKIYMAAGNYLHAINQPNNLGSSCDFKLNALSLNGGNTIYNLPNFPNAYGKTAAVQFSAPAVCVGAQASFSAQITVPSAGAVANWNFGDSKSGANNLASGLKVAHTYTTPGSYTVTLSVVIPGNPVPITTTEQVVIYGQPQIAPTPLVQTLCPGQTVILSPGPQPSGSTYRWQDGSTLPTLTASVSGKYIVTVTSVQGCTNQGEYSVVMLANPTVNLGRDTTVCEDAPLVLNLNPQPAGSTFRWQDGSASSTFSTREPGTFSVEVTLPTGCVGKDEIIVRPSNCPVQIPNIITPNHDRLNETFYIKGLNVKDWQLIIFNRWGSKVYQADSYDNGWDANGNPPGVYYYQLKNSTTHKLLKGWIQVVH